MLAAEVRNLDSLFQLTEEHGVIAHLAAALGECPQQPLRSEFLEMLRARHRMQLLFTLAMTAELFRILQMLRDANIETVVVKGPVLALRAYGDPAARRYVDLDMVVRHREISRAAEILMAAGYQSKVPAQAIRAGKVPGEYLFRRPGTQVIFELHTEKTFRYFPRPLPVEDYFARKTSLLLDGQPVPALCAEDEFVLICIHGAKHFWERLMWISDVAAMVHNRADLDWQLVLKAAEDVGASRMLHLALVLAQRVLRVPVPVEMRQEVSDDPACERIAKQIESWLPYSGFAAPAFASRAFFRFQMRGGLLAGAGYLARLSISTTEEDWAGGADVTGTRMGEILRRPFRLARKYRRNTD